MQTLHYLILALSVIGLSLQSCDQVENAPEKSPLAEHVLIIGVDGLSPDGIQHAATPHLDALMKSGAFSFEARAVMPSSSGANWGSMLLGAGPEQHGITTNDWKADSVLLPPTVARTGNYFPSLFSLLKDQRPDALSALILDWNPIAHFIEAGVVSWVVRAKNEEDTTKEAMSYIKNKKPTLCFVHLDHVDGAGHGAGHGTPTYYQAIAKADSLIGEILASLDEAEISKSTLIMVSSDHGGIEKGHGGTTPNEMLIPFIVAGPSVKANRQLTQPINVYDVASTAAFALGLEQPYAWISRPVIEAFK